MTRKKSPQAQAQHFGLAQPALLTPQSRLDARFHEFITAHGNAYDDFRAVAWELRREGYQRISAHHIGYILRYRPVKGDHREAGEQYRFNNAFSSRLARMLIDREPSFANYFELRRLQDGSEVAA